MAHLGSDRLKSIENTVYSNGLAIEQYFQNGLNSLELICTAVRHQRTSSSASSSSPFNARSLHKTSMRALFTSIQSSVLRLDCSNCLCRSALKVSRTFCAARLPRHIRWMHRPLVISKRLRSLARRSSRAFARSVSELDGCDDEGRPERLICRGFEIPENCVNSGMIKRLGR